MSSPSRSRTAQPPEERTLRRLAESLELGVLCVRDGCVAWSNPFLMALAGRGEAILGLKIEDLLEDAGQGLPRDGGPELLTCRLPRSGAEPRELLCRRVDAGAPPDGAGAAGHRQQTWTLEDVTRLHALETELHRTGRELAGANRETAELSERLASERAEREELLSVVSHELRTPLTVIGGYNRLLLEGEAGPINEEQRRFLVESRKGCERLNSFVGNLIEASRADKGVHVLELGHGPVRTVIEGVVAMLRPLFEDRGMTLAVDASGVARFDRARLEQVLTNLLGNAIKFGHSGGHIDVTARPLEVTTCGARGFVEIAVADDGPGIAAADRERIFDPYVQVGDAGGRGGLGLGLSICRRLVEAHGGEIRVDARGGGGARFVFTLPAAES
jgi:signal transduction histidine kinase